MTGFGPIYGLLVRRLLRPRRLVGFGVLAALPGFLLLVVDRGFFDSDALAYQQVTVQLYLTMVLPLVALLLASSALGDERRENTMPYLYLKPVRRWVVVVAATAAAVTAAGAVGLIGWGVGWVVSGQVTGSWDIALPVLAALAINVVLYAAAFVPLGYLTRWSVLIGLAYIFVWEAVLASFIDALSPSSLQRIGLSAYAAIADLGRETLELLGTVKPGVGGAVAKTAVIAGLSVLVTTTILRRADTR
ncbi:MAG: ABC transporter permease [Acidimicrobiia bacterium]